MFVGGCTLEAAEARRANADDELRDGTSLMALAALVDQSLLQRSEEPERRAALHDAGDHPRVRAGAAVAGGELEPHTSATCATTWRWRSRPSRSSPPRPAALARSARADHDNLRAALAWAVDHDAAGALRLGAALSDFWHMRGHLSEGRQWLERVLAVADAQATDNAEIGGSADCSATDCRPRQGTPRCGDACALTRG